MRQERYPGEFDDEDLPNTPEPLSFRSGYVAAVFAVGLVLLVASIATAKEADPYSQLGFVTPNNVTVVPKSKGPRGIMRHGPAIKRALEADVRRVEA